jgi:hypothetical protein
MAALAAAGVALALVVLCAAAFHLGRLVEKMKADQT